MSLNLNLKESMQEMLSKTEAQIETDAGLSWLSRSCACFILASKAQTLEEKIKWITRGEDNSHEALEHSALSEDLNLFSEVKKEVEQYKKLAYNSLKG